MTFSFTKDPIKIQSRKTGKVYTVVSADNVQLDERCHGQIVKICNEPEIYSSIFATIFKGKQYTLENARVFTTLVSEGWKNGNRFDWLILHEAEIVGTIGIKSLEGEIGYWQSNKHPGVMTLASDLICNLSKEAGFHYLWAYVDKTNTASIKVLEGAGFKLDSDLTAKREDTYGYRLNLA